MPKTARIAKPQIVSAMRAVIDDKSFTWYPRPQVLCMSGCEKTKVPCKDLHEAEEYIRWETGYTGVISWHDIADDLPIYLNKHALEWVRSITPLHETEGWRQMPDAERVSPNADGSYTCPYCGSKNHPEVFVCWKCRRGFLKETAR